MTTRTAYLYLKQVMDKPGDKTTLRESSCPQSRMKNMADCADAASNASSRESDSVLCEHNFAKLRLDSVGCIVVAESYISWHGLWS